MEKVLKLYTYNGGAVVSTPFPNAEEQVIITDFQYDAGRMSGAPSISAKIMHRLCLDDLWTDNVYAEFNGEKYFVMNTPSSNKDNDDTRYEHEVELLSEREVLNHIYFIDAVQGDSTVDVYKSNSTKVIFMGDINEFASRLNSSLSYSNVGYNVVVDEGIVTEAKLVSFEDKYIMSALQEIFNIYEVPYYFVGKIIHIGYTDNTIPNVFKYGFEDALLSISKNNANYEVVRRCTGIGSSDNIPYYYPNESDDRAAIEASGKKWITPTQNLMPPIYRETEGAERFYNAVNDTYPSPEGGYYTFENLHSTRTPNEKIVSFEDIKPSIVGMTNANGQRIDQFIAIAFDKNDNDEYDEENNTYVHPYFFVKLPKYNGSFGFNLFDHAIENGAMTISMTNGVCGACNFEIGVGESSNQNIVQVDDNGNLKRDENGNVLWRDQTPQPRQNDTQNYEVWIALKKDESTYGQIMPNASQNLRPSVGDTFVILNINLPQSYILAAEEKLKDSIIKYMFLNNNERFTFSVNFSRIYFAENPDVLAMMNENARILIEYNGKQHTLYISSFSYKMNSDSPLPEISVELTDELAVGQNSLQNALDQIKNDILSSIGDTDFLKQGLKYFIRKDIDDIAKGKISFRKGLDVGNFSSLISGGTFRLDADGKSYLEVDKLLVRMKAIFEVLQIKQASYIGGEQYVTPAAMEVKRVIDGDTYYRCYATEDDNTPYDITFAIGDQALSKMADLTSGEEVSNRYYWRLVVNVGENYIDLSKTDADSGSDVPQIGDTIISLGNRSDKDRQNAIIISSVSLDSPSIKMLQGIDSYTLTDKDIISQGFETTTKRAFLRIVGDFFAGSSDNSTYAKYDAGKNEFEIKGKFITRGGKDIDTALSELQNQIDGNIETWFYKPEPTLDNEPAVNWELNSEKDSHLGDLYYSGEGKAYRFQKDSDIYIWKLIQDTDITKALEEAKNAKDAAADAKTTADNAQTAVGDLNNYVDGSFKDGIITNAEAVAIEKYLNTVDESKKSIEGSYLILYANKYLEGTPKSNLKNAYDAVIASINTLVSKINTAISDSATTVQEKNEVDIAFASFNTKQQDYEKAIENANNAIQDKLKSFTDKVANDVAGYEYLKTAFANDTTIKGGVVSTSIVYTGYKNPQGKFVPMSGINGVYLEDETKGHGISYWAGGNIIDRETYINPEDIPADAAKAVIRMDGSGYFANGNLTWTKDGILYADPLSFFVGEEKVGDILKLFAPIYDESDRETIVGISARYPLAVQGGVTAYAGTPISLPNIFQGLMLDPSTLKWNENGQLTVIGGAGSDFDAAAMWSALLAETGEQINKSHLTTALKGYATLTDVDTRIDDLVNGAPAAFDTLKEIADVLQGNVDSIGDIIETLGTKWTQDDTKIDNWDDAYDKRHTHSNKTVLDGITSALITNWNTAYKNNHTHANKTVLDGITSTKVTNWNKAYGWGNHAAAGYALKTYVDEELKKYVTLADEQTIDGLKHFTSGLSIGENKHKIYEQDGNIILDGNLLVTGGITAYSDGTGSGGSGGGIDVEVLWEILGGEGEQQINVAHLTDALIWNNISNKPSTFTPSAHTHAISDITSLSTELGKKVSSVTVTGTGNAITAASITNGVLTLTKGATYNNYSLPLASSTVRGGVKIGYTENGRNYPVELSNEKMFVNVPWTDTKYTLSSFGITATAAEINKLDGATITTTELNYLDGVTSNVQTQLNNSFKEAYLQWGGKNFTNSYGCIDAAMIPDLGSNRLAFMPADSIEVQYSRDGGKNWSDYSTSDTNKLNFFNGNGSAHLIGANSSTGIDKSNYQLRFIITTNVAKIYTILNKFCIYCSTNGSSGSWCTIDGKTKSNVDAGNDTWTIFANKIPIGGWPGYNIINTPGIITYGYLASQFQKLRFTFGVNSHPSTSTYAGLSVYKIYGFGGIGWSTPSNMARHGRIYSYDSQQNVTFPGSVTATEFSGLVGGYTASRALVSNSLGKIAVSAVTSTELGYLDGVTSSIQTQLNSKLNSSSYTASDVLTKLKTVDGANSGLDADLLDGTHKSGLFTALSSNTTTNLSITIGGTTKSIADLAANTAAKLQTARTLWGKSFDGTANITGALTSVTDITGTGTFTSANTKVTDSVYINGIRLYKSADGTIKIDGNLLVTGGITAYSTGEEGGGSGGGIDIDVLWDILGGTGTQQINKTHLTDALSGYLTTVNLATITDLHSSWDAVLKAQKPNYLTSVSIATISDLNSGWDALLKAAPSVYVTRHPTISEVTGKQNLIIKLNSGTKEGTNMFTYNATAAKTVNITPSAIGAAASSHNHNSIYVGGYKTRNHGNSSNSYTADTYSSTYVNKDYTAFAERGSWSYADNGYITTDFGNIHLAGTAIFQWGANDSTKTQLFITPFSSSGISSPLLGEMLYYISNGSGFGAGWTRVLTSRNYSGILDSRYVNVSGDTMTGTLTINSGDNYGLIINRNVDSLTYYQIRGINKGSVGYEETVGTNLYNTACQKSFGVRDNGEIYFDGNKVWHAGNDGSGSGLDADLLDGTHKSGLFTALSSNTTTNLSITIGGTTKSIADLAANTAAKLQTARTVWGQSFDGTGNVSGNMTGVGIISASNGSYYISDSKTNPYLRLIAGGVTNYVQVLNDGKFVIGQSSTTRNNITINTNGNVGIGTSSPSYKLDVNGDILANGWLRTTGNTGWYNQTYGGGWYMTDSDWIITYNNKGVRGLRFDSYGIYGNSWNAGYGAFSVQIQNNEQQTPLLLAYRNYTTDTGANRLFAMELSNSGNSIRFSMGGSVQMEIFKGNNITVYTNILSQGGITCYSSDERAKTVLEHIDLKLKDIANAPTIRFKWNDWKIKDDGKTHIGGIAQYMQKLLPETVLEADGALNMDYSTTAYIFSVQTARHLINYETKTDKELRRLKKRVLYLEQQLKNLGYEEVDIISD